MRIEIDQSGKIENTNKPKVIAFTGDKNKSLIIFAGEKQKPFISSIKGAVGESFSSGGIRTAAMAISIREQTLPPTLGLNNPIKPLPFILHAKKEARIHYGLVNGFSSGGTFVSIVLKRIDEKD